MKYQRNEISATKHLCEEIGYGRVMQLAEELWREKAITEGFPGSEHTTGPCASFMVNCPHTSKDENDHCNICCGSGRITKWVYFSLIPFKQTARTIFREPTSDITLQALHWMQDKQWFLKNCNVGDNSYIAKMKAQLPIVDHIISILQTIQIKPDQIIVPVQPTEAMMLNESTCQSHPPFDMNCVVRKNRMRIWKAMLQAAPKAGQ